jgi:hypothetical protein
LQRRDHHPLLIQQTTSFSCQWPRSAGVDISVIALWLKHKSIKATQIYLHAHLALKEAALAKIKPFDRQKGGRYKPKIDCSPSWMAYDPMPASRSAH